MTFSKKNNQKKVKFSRKLRTYSGGCGCGAEFKGGSAAAGGVNDFVSFKPDLISSNLYKPLNSYENDPTSPTMITNSRNLPNMSFGGSKYNRKRRMKKNRKTKKSTKKSSKRFHKGGFSVFSGSNSLMGDVSSSGMWNASNIFNMKGVVDSAPYSQPLSSTYNENRSPLV